jgi:CheY-like chemotaxis protein
MLEQMLLREGYFVQTASSREQALEQVAADRFHVAVIDARLDNRDPYNHDGFQLMRDVRYIDPSTGIILLTLRDDLDIVREALYAVSGEMNPVFETTRASASDFVIKTPDELRRLPDCVRRVLDEVVKVDWALRIVDPEQFLFQIARRMRYANSPEAARLQEELEELLSKLFTGFDRIDVHTIAEQNQGYNKAFVFQATPFLDEEPTPVLVAKVGELKMIEREVRRFREYLEHGGNGSHSPSALTAVRRTRTLGGMIYRFDGLSGEIRDFAQFFRGTRDRALIGEVISNLFINTLAFGRHGKRVTRQNVDLREVYRVLLRLDADELQAKLDELGKIARSLGRSALSEKFWLEPSTRLLNPVEYALTGSFTGSYIETTIHGELHGHTVLVDACNDTWLVDFANTGKGPLLQDYIAFEASLLIENNEVPPGKPLFEWSRLLFEQPGELFPRLPNRLANMPEVAKMHHAVLTVRRLAYNELKTPEACRAYLIGLFFTTLRMITVKFLAPPKRFHALMVSAMIAENLVALEDGAPPE